MNVVSRCLILVTMMSAATPAVACETDPDISQLPGETEKDAAERFKQTFADQSVISAYRREQYGLDKASVIYIAKVASSDPGVLGSRDIFPSATVQPLGSIKGTLPTTNRRLTISSQSSCFTYGDGDGASAKSGTLVIVFEGLPKSDWHPNGIDSIRATDARTFELLDPLYPYGKPIPHPWGE